MAALLLFLGATILFLTLIILAGRTGTRTQVRSLINETYLLAAGSGRRDRGL